jgi:hypothetical protein
LLSPLGLTWPFPCPDYSRYLDNPSSQHEVALKRVFRHLNGAIGHGLTFQACGSEPFVYGYSDADCAGDVETRKSTSGHAFFVAEGLVSWKSSFQSIVTLSSTEAEYAALAENLREAAWLQSLLAEIGLEQAKLKPLRIFEDSQPAIKLTINQASSNRTKQMDSLNLWVRRSGGTSSRSCASHNVTTMRPQRFESSASLVSNQGLHFGTSIDQSEGGGCVCTMSSLGLALTMAHLCIRQKNVCLSIA